MKQEEEVESKPMPFLDYFAEDFALAFISFFSSFVLLYSPLASPFLFFYF